MFHFLFIAKTTSWWNCPGLSYSIYRISKHRYHVSFAGGDIRISVKLPVAMFLPGGRAPLSTAPVMYEARSEAIKAASSAISSGWPNAEQCLSGYRVPGRLIVAQVVPYTGIFKPGLSHLIEG